MNKTDFRRQIREKLAGFDLSYIIYSNNGLFRRLGALPEFTSAGTIFAFWSIALEPDTHSIIGLCMSRGQRVALPVCHEGNTMTFHLFSPGDVLSPSGAYRIPEPAHSAPELIPEKGDVILVPGLCYDESLYRIGHGCGYYDRYLQGCCGLAVGLTRERLVLPEIPRESHDRPVDLLITEEKTRGG